MALIALIQTLTEDPAAKKAVSWLAVILLGVSLGTLVIIMGFVLIARNNKRLGHERARTREPKTDTSIDPWAESAKRMNDDDVQSLAEPDIVDPDSHTRSDRRITHEPRFDPPLPPLSSGPDDGDVDPGRDTGPDTNNEPPKNGPPNDNPPNNNSGRTPPKHGGPKK